MKRSFLEGLGLEKEVIDKIMAENGKDVEALKAVKTELETAKNTIAEKDKLIGELKTSNGDNAKLQEQIKAHEATIEKLKTDADNANKTYALRAELSKAGILDPDYVIYKQGGIGKFKFTEDNKVDSLDDIIKTLRTDKSMQHLFSTRQHYEPTAGGNSLQNPFRKETFNLTEQGKMLRENPAQAKEMAAAAGIKI